MLYGVLVKAANYAAGAVTFDWGDGSPVTTQPDPTVETAHTYAAGLGAVTITVTDSAATTATVEYTALTLMPYVTYDQPTQPLWLGVGVAHNDPQAGTVTVNFGDGTTLPMTDEEAILGHTYAAAGVYLLDVGETTGGSVTMRVPVGQNLNGSPHLTVTHLSGRTYRFTPVTPLPDGANDYLRLNFGDGEQDTTYGVTHVDHTYAANGTFNVVSVLGSNDNACYVNTVVVTGTSVKQGRRKR